MSATKTLEERQIEGKARKKGALLHARVDRPLVLVGMPGAGKSKTGAFLAQCLKLPFLDTDREIQQAAGCSVAEIFARDGEGAFRAAESRLMTRLVESDPCVIATGGGTITNPQVWENILQKCLAIWIDADLGLLVRRTQGNSDRPLLAAGDVRARLEELSARRGALYARAPLAVSSRDAPPALCVLDILEKLEEALPCRP
ncbi:MAG TPA: shikimate kinase [Alphaproteobacteria bacterium]|nr:shikimate kinase [Alphaproteobacteria bacterium]